jgi:hypothetical protein
MYVCVARACHAAVPEEGWLAPGLGFRVGGSRVTPKAAWQVHPKRRGIDRLYSSLMEHVTQGADVRGQEGER